MSRHSDPSRDLLFGLLALQVGLIDQGQLVAAFQAWTRDKARGLADHLAARGALDDDQRGLLDALAAQHLRKNGGDAEKSLASLAVGRSTREALKRVGDAEVDATLTLVGGASTEPADHDRTATYAIGSATSDGQRFRVLRPHAQGGLGAVFVALDGELHREVALKQILDHHADDPVSRQRFLVEAEITGRLEHPGIVPVYGLGAYAGGRPFYAMRFIRGDSLKDAIAAFHKADRPGRDPGSRALALRNLLRRFTDVCNAIDYAHGRGILHRDLKPGNVILGKHGETLVVDWGLAKPVGRLDPGSANDERTLVPTSADGSAETLPGTAMGTPAYMSPEQARGDIEHLGPRSDVYSLGATLYCLLTGKPPFDGGGVGAILSAVQKGDFPTPRSVDLSIPAALEAVCLKAMATAPESRYATPRALADDVERWAADEPVSARPEPFAERARRWMRRRRTAVTAAAAALVMATLGLASVLAVQSKANADLTKANGLLTDSVRRETKANADLAAASAKIQARFDLALEAIKTFHTGVAEDVLLKNNNLRPLRDRLLKNAAEFYERLETQLSGQPDRSSRRSLAQAYTEVAFLANRIGSTEKAAAGLRQALAVRRALAKEAQDDFEAKAAVGSSLNNLGTVLRETGRAEEARASYEEARTLLEDLTQSNPAVDRFRQDLARVYNNIGSLIVATGKPDEAIDFCRRALGIREQLARADPAAAQAQTELAQSHTTLGTLLSAAGKHGDAFLEEAAAREIYQALVDAEPAVTAHQMDLATSEYNLGISFSKTDRSAEALAAYRRSLALLERLADANPAATQFQRHLAINHGNIGALLSRNETLEDALVSFRASTAILQKLADAEPAVIQFQLQLAVGQTNIGVLLKEMGDSETALTSLRSARATLQRCADSKVASTEIQIERANNLLENGDTLRVLGKPSAARSSYEEATAIIRRLVKAQPGLEKGCQMLLTFGQKGLGATQQSAGRVAEAVATWHRAIEDAERIQSRSGVDSYYLAGCHARLGGIADVEGSGLSTADGAAELDKAMEVLRRAVAAGYRNVTWMARDPDLDPLRGRPDFRLLMTDLAFPADPFAKAPAESR